MRPFCLSAICLVWVCACSPNLTANPSPSDRFYTPTGIAFVDGPTPKGRLLVASSNFTRLYDQAALLAVDLSRVHQEDGGSPVVLPELGNAFGLPDGGLDLTDLGIADPNKSVVEVQSITGELAVWKKPTGDYRFFTVSRAEGNPFQFGDVDGESLSCPYAPSNAPTDCFSTAPSLTTEEKKGNGKPASPAPIGITVILPEEVDGGTFDAGIPVVYATSSLSATSPAGSNKSPENFLFTTSAANPVVIDSAENTGGSFISLETPEPTFAVTASSRYIYTTTFSFNQTVLRVVDRNDTTREFNSVLALENTFRVGTVRGLAITEPDAAGTRRLFIAGQGPDTLLVLTIFNEATDSPGILLVNVVTLPSLPTGIKLLPRPGMNPLVAIACTGANSLAIYDDSIGAVVAQVQNIGIQPYYLDVQRVGNLARLFVTDFGDGRVAVIDLDVNNASAARLVAHLGKICLESSLLPCP